MERKKITPVDVQAMKKQGKRITMLTAYDYPMALLEDRAGIDIILVGDSLAMTVLGHENTLPVTMDEMIHHTKAVARGAKHCLILGDMPFMSYNTSEREAILNAGRFMKEAGADAVKLEGGVSVKETVRAIVRGGIPVMGHIGLTPQTISMLGGFKVQGKDAQAAQKIIDDAALSSRRRSLLCASRSGSCPDCEDGDRAPDGSNDRDRRRCSLRRASPGGS